MTAGQPRVWVLADPRAGTAAQALGIAERLGEPFHTVPLTWNGLARMPLPFASLAGLTPAAREALAAPWPRLAISAGRRSGPVALWLGKRGVRTVHCMRCAGSAALGLHVLGRHDEPPEAPNVLAILGAAHRVTPARLAEAREEWGALGTLLGPRVGLLVGGPVRGTGFDPGFTAALGARVARFAGSVMATASRRTGAEATDALAAALDPVPHRLHRWGGQGPNPLLGFMAWADLLVVTGDSVSMLSEALVTTAPIFIAETGSEGRRHFALHRSLYDAGQARPLAEAPARFARKPLDETARIAAAIRARGLLA